jgi:endogenous inhibitor of DNA gyrase (YacG/DUF329 family)
MSGEDTAPKAGGRCPICGQPTVQATRPFCSKRCAEVDLHRWFSGRYAIPVVEDDELSEDGPEEGR